MSFLENIDKNKLQKIVLIVISALTLAAITLLLTIIVLSIRPQSPTVDQEIEFKTVAVENKDVNTGTLILADDDHPYTPNEQWLDLVDCKNYRNQALGLTKEEADSKDTALYAKKKYLPYGGMMLNSVAMEQAHKMLIDTIASVEDDNVSGSITIDGAYAIQYNVSPDLDEFKTGLLLFLSDSTSDSGVHVKLPDAYATWLKANAAKYGFVESFKDAYRYVGVTHATYMAEKELTLADYINHLKKNHSADKKMLEVGDYGVYYVSCKAGDSINVPANNEYTVSGTNEGGVIVTVKLK
jgi:LAS superfamily LD-carboxypeptidase LdcB